MSRRWLPLADLVALVVALYVTFAVRAAAKHHELLTVHSLSTFVGRTLVVAAPALLFVSAASGLYAAARPVADFFSTGAVVAWTTCIVVFVAAYKGGPLVPLVTVVPGFFVTWAVIGAVHELVHRGGGLRRAPGASAARRPR